MVLVGKVAVILGVIIMIFTIYLFTSTSYFDSTTTWEAYDSPEDAGWSIDKLDEAKEYYDSLNSTAAIAIYDGKVLFSWGNVSKNSNAHSVRKSFLSSLYGIQEGHGNIDIDHTLHELNIDDQPRLSITEKNATIRDLLTSSSGVFHRAGEESWGMMRNRPTRGSHEPGAFFYYNNWDFNVLGTIYNNKTNNDLFLQFKEQIADPIGMEDFDLSNTEYRTEVRRSIHPSYLFQVSARDMARFGQLYLQEGNWDGEQIIPKDWIESSTTPQVNVLSNDVFDYGYMWWVATSGPFKDLGLYSAVGRYGQSIDIIPELNLVFVHRVDSNRRLFQLFPRGVNQEQRLRLLNMIIEAKK
ncbi:serine hydrolase [Evansella sp. AB-P1]|uniref:serine hydrolase domain-containing protein n=1 Tax=Evansella sp. AB-P1 TaxID=3037653 RepID=UPI00241D727D|nr:serine hydrolase [Evansella sp. AB-P1]MDG5789578.1 serine hydrolase [Evansella sp. AB-P1]